MLIFMFTVPSAWGVVGVGENVKKIDSVKFSKLIS